MSDADAGKSVARDIISNAAAGAISGAAGSGGSPSLVAVGAGIGALAGGGGRLILMAVEHLRTPSDRQLFEAQERLAADALNEAAPKISEKLEDLKEAVGGAEAAATVVPTVRRWSKSWFDAEGKKRRVLMAVLVSAFDPESYKAAMSHRFFAIIDGLDYPEIRHLVAFTHELRRTGRTRPGAWSVLDRDSYGDEGPAHRDRLAAHGLLIVKSPSQVAPTWLGLELVTFLERGGYSGEDPRKAPKDEDE